MWTNKHKSHLCIVMELESIAPALVPTEVRHRYPFLLNSKQDVCTKSPNKLVATVFFAKEDSREVMEKFQFLVLK